MKNQLHWLLLVSLWPQLVGSATAQQAADREAAAFPSRALKIVVPFPAGGPSDVLARMVGQKMSEDWGRPVVIENRVGANTVIGAQAVQKAPADGYTMLMAIDSTLAMNQFLYRNLPYDPFIDFVPITLVAKTMMFIFVNAASELKSVDDLVAGAKMQPGKFSFGAGTITSKLMNVAVNLSPMQFKSQNLVQLVFSALANSGLAPTRLELEITESVLLQNEASTLSIMHQLRALGVRIAMDDFGTGYSSLAYLRSFPFDKIKIDRSFVRDMAKSEECVAIVRAITGLARSLNIITVVEGIETAAQLEIVRSEGCDECQGYLLGRPMRETEVRSILDQETCTASAA